MYQQSLQRVAQRYAKVRRITMASPGTYLMRECRYFDRLASGRVTIRRAEQARLRLAEHWPDGLLWPADIPRPAPTESRIAQVTGEAMTDLRPSTGGHAIRNQLHS